MSSEIKFEGKTLPTSVLILHLGFINSYFSSAVPKYLDRLSWANSVDLDQN